MNYLVRLTLNPEPGQQERLVALQVAFARACNEIAPLVQQTRVWNRVALHHMAYKGMRARFPQLGSQMVCNAIYAVSRSARLIFQTAGSPFHVSRMEGRALPLLRFADTCPVYFDRHTLSMKEGQISMFTLDGRMKFQLALEPEQEGAFHARRLLEIVLQRRNDGFELSFLFDLPTEQPAVSDAAIAAESGPHPGRPVADISHQPLVGRDFATPSFPEYLRVEEVAV